VGAEGPAGLRLLHHVAEAGRASARLAFGPGVLAIFVSDAVGPRSRPATPEEWERLASWLAASERLRPPAPGQCLSRRLHGSLVRAVLRIGAEAAS
jgi:hypothetical protein